MKNKQSLAAGNGKLPTVTVGIAAYNEEANIKPLLQNLLSQKQTIFHLEKIIVLSDGSTDKTVSLAKSLNSKLLEVVDNRERMGGRRAKSEVIKKSKSDILVVLDADVLPENSHFIENLIFPIIHDGASLVGASTIPLKGKSYFEQVNANAHMLKKNIYQQISNGNNVYMCHGRGRAFSKDFYSTIGIIPSECPEDAYSYLLAMKNGLKFVFNKDAVVLFRATSNLNQRKSQSKRFLMGRSGLKKYFKKEFVDNEFKIPIKYVILGLFTYGIKHPFLTLAYFFWLLYIKVSKTKPQDNNKWDVATSSKKLI